MNLTKCRRRRLALPSALIGLCVMTARTPAGALEAVRISADGKDFVLGDSGRRFRVWGVNYDHDAVGNGRLLEDYWDKEWATVRQDFHEIHDLGANVVRIHLQLARFLVSTNTPDAAALARLGKLVGLAEETGVYLDLTGLGCYHKQDVPSWYDKLDETARWEVQAAFWRAVARTCRGSAAVFCYDLMNEPVIGGNESEGWLAGELGGNFFVQRLTLDQHGRSQKEIAGAWVEKLTTAIRREDPDHLVTVGVIPWAMVWPTAKPVFYSPEVAKHLDFVSVHFYPKAGEVDKALKALAVYDIGKPLVIEELFPLNCSVGEMDEFIKGSQGMADGWISFYWGKTIEEYEAAKEPGLVDALVGGWLRHFKEQAPRFRQP
jgi:hypothetical protein